MRSIRLTRQQLAWIAIGVGVAAIATLGTRKVTQVRTRRQRLLPPRDYSSRSGFPKGTEVSRGLASSFQVPEDFRTPAALQPFV
jgi:hypothetical protein